MSADCRQQGAEVAADSAYPGFPRALVDLVRCQRDGGRLTVAVPAGSGATHLCQAELCCVTCSTRHLIVDGVLDLLSIQLPVDPVRSQEIAARDREATVYDTAFFSDADNEMEIPSTLDGLALDGKVVADLGCGTGRITVHLLPRADLILAADYSLSSLHVLARKIGGYGNVGLVLADATQLCLAEGAFDIAVSTQVVEHIPAAELRLAFLQRMRACLRPGGDIVLTAYHYSLRKRLLGDRAGFHGSTIYYHRFAVQELRDEVAQIFTVCEARPIQLRLPAIHRLPLPWGRISRAVERTPVLRDLGHLVLIRAKK
jgi:ubiquinone/menaquinone biosynthesis C-methylase UbiE